MTDDRNAAALAEHQRKVYLDFLRERAGVEPPEPEPEQRATPKPKPQQHDCFERALPVMTKAIGLFVGRVRQGLRAEFKAELATMQQERASEIGALKLEIAELRGALGAIRRLDCTEDTAALSAGLNGHAHRN